MVDVIMATSRHDEKMIRKKELRLPQKLMCNLLSREALNPDHSSVHNGIKSS
jgi:hypothetical protein